MLKSFGLKCSLFFPLRLPKAQAKAVHEDEDENEDGGDATSSLSVRFSAGTFFRFVKTIAAAEIRLDECAARAELDVSNTPTNIFWTGLAQIFNDPRNIEKLSEIGGSLRDVV